MIGLFIILTDRGISIPRFAKMSTVSKESLYAYKNKKRMPKLNTIQLMVNALNRTVDTITIGDLL